MVANGNAVAGRAWWIVTLSGGDVGDCDLMMAPADEMFEKRRGDDVLQTRPIQVNGVGRRDGDNVDFKFGVSS